MQYNGILYFDFLDTKILQFVSSILLWGIVYVHH